MKIIILDVGRGISRIDSTKSYPSALTMDREGHSVMDWLLSAFDVLEHQEIVLVGGHHIEKIIQNYPHLKFYYNPNWQTTGSLESLLLAEKELEGPCLISYSDVVYRPEVIKSLLTHTGKNHPIALATAKIDKEKLYDFLREMEFNRLLSQVISHYGESAEKRVEKKNSAKFDLKK